MTIEKYEVLKRLMPTDREFLDATLIIGKTNSAIRELIGYSVGDYGLIKREGLYEYKVVEKKRDGTLFGISFKTSGSDLITMLDKYKESSSSLGLRITEEYTNNPHTWIVIK